MDRMEFSREAGLALKDIGSLDALVGLLVVAREAEVMEAWEHFLTSTIILDMFPIVVARTPQLQSRWPDLFGLLRLVLWQRIYNRQYTFPSVPSIDDMRERIGEANTRLSENVQSDA